MRARAFVAVIALLVLAVALARSFEPSKFLLRANRFACALAGKPLVSPEAAGFWFDQDYAAFLSDIRAKTPDTATVAVIVPPLPDVYLYQAIYRLAPRRVVETGRWNEASYVATYRTEAARGPEGRPILGGTLWSRSSR